MRKNIVFLVFFALALFILGAFFTSEVQKLTAFFQAYPVGGAFLYVLVMMAGVILVPFSTTPISALAPGIWGLPLGIFLSALGWWFGCVLMFLLARFVGAKFLSKTFSKDRTQKIQKAFAGPRGFFAVLVSHMILPVELPAFAAGASHATKLRVYLPASFLGIIFTASVIVGSLGSVLSGQWQVAIVFGVLALALFVVGRLVWKRFFV